MLYNESIYSIIKRRQKMCGIFAILNSSQCKENLINYGFTQGRGRGPESSILDTFCSSTVTLGFHRLAINGLNNTSNQPLVRGSLRLICNGEIYNFKQLYDMLHMNATTQSDCEVILHLYERFGIEKTVQLLDGVFAFVLVDLNEKKIHVARDMFGVRPLYRLSPSSNITTSSFIIGFSSEMKQLTEIYHENRSLYTIQHFPPGTIATYGQTNSPNLNLPPLWVLEKERKWTMATPSTFTFSYTREEEVCYEDAIQPWLPLIRDRLVEAVEKRCGASERPIACLLSGGLDSSLVTALVNQYHIKHGLPKLETFSIGLAGSTDLVYAKKVAEYLGTKHTEILLTKEDFFQSLPEVVRTIESYDTTTVRASIGNFLVGQFIRNNSEAKVIFNGDGSDEVTGGYLYFHKAPNAVEFDLECRRLLEDIHMFDVLRSDRCISSHGLEPRTPFLDKAFVQTYLSIPSMLRFYAKHGKCEKHLLRTAFSTYMDIEGKSLLPDDVLWRKKEAFSDGVTAETTCLSSIISSQLIPLRDHIHGYFSSTSLTTEQLYYKLLFEKTFKTLDHIIPYYWMPKFIEGVFDASARSLAVYQEVSM